MNNDQKGSNFYMLTAQILNDKNLSHAEKLTMAILNGLADEKGKCWPSNEWLSEKLDIHTRKVQEILENLVKNNYIKREVLSCSSNPFKKYRIIYVCSDFKFCLRDAENGTLDIAENGMMDMPKTACIIDKTSSLIDKKETRPSASCSHPEAGNVTILLIQAIKKTKPDLKDPKVTSWKTVIDRMLRIDNRSLTTVLKLIEWLPTNEFWSKNILSAESFRDKFDRLELEMSKKPKNTLQVDQDLLKKLEKHFAIYTKYDVKIGHDYIEFPSLSSMYGKEGRKAYFKIGENGFQENVMSCLRKIGVPVK